MQSPVEVADRIHLLNVTEDAGPNRDRAGRIAEFLRSCGISSPAPWCAAFVYHCHIEAGVSAERLPARHLAASTYQWAKWAAAHGRLRTLARANGLPQRGDLFLWNASLSFGRVGPTSGSGHIGFVCSATRDRGSASRLEQAAQGRVLLRTIEGNSNADGGRDGTALIRRGSRSGMPGEAKLTPNTTEAWRIAGSNVHWIDMSGVGR